MKITVKLFANYREGRFESKEEFYPENTRVKDIVSSLNITEKEGPIGILLVNGKHAGQDDLLNDGDTVSIFPMLGGG